MSTDREARLRTALAKVEEILSCSPPHWDTESNRILGQAEILRERIKQQIGSAA